MRLGGRIAFIGFLGGTAMQIDAVDLIRSGATVHALRVGSRAMFGDLLRAIGQHRLQPVVDRVFPFNEAPAAFRHLAQAAHFGKVVVLNEA